MSPGHLPRAATSPLCLKWKALKPNGSVIIRSQKVTMFPAFAFPLYAGLG